MGSSLLVISLATSWYITGVVTSLELSYPNLAGVKYVTRVYQTHLSSNILVYI